MNWDDYFIRIADTVRSKSKDPSSKIGAVIVGPENQIISTGYNGFPTGVNEGNDRWERPTKYEYVVHAEVNAICNAAKHGIALRDSTLYLVGMGPPTSPCMNCSKTIIQSGIKKVVGAYFKPVSESWLDELNLATSMLEEGDVLFEEYGPLEKRV